VDLIDFFLSQLDFEAERSRRVLASVPEGRDDWKPHAKSMPLGRLALLVAHMPSWFALIVEKEELDLSPPPGSSAIDQRPLRSNAELMKAFEQSVFEGRRALSTTTDERLLTTTWKLLQAGKVVMDEPRVKVVRDTFTHQAHHRAQLALYLRLNEVPVPATYGPSADDARFD